MFRLSSQLEKRAGVGRAAGARMADGLLKAVRGLWLTDPSLGPKPLLAKLREQQPDLAAGGTVNFIRALHGLSTALLDISAY